GDRRRPHRPRPAGRVGGHRQPAARRGGRGAGRRAASGAAGRPRGVGRRGRGLHRQRAGGGRGHRRRRLRPGLEAAPAGPGPRRPRSGLPVRRGRRRPVTALRGTLRIARRELRAYLVAPWAYGMATIFLVLTGTIFFVVADGSREASLRFWFPNLAFVLIVTAPIVTSRLVAEEWRSRHLDILLARPISPVALVVGKWLAAVAFFVLLLVPTLVYSAFLAAWGSPDWPPLIASYVGALLLVGFFCAIGTMASALTPTAVAAGLGAFAVLVVAQLANNVPAFHGLSFQPHLESFARGAPGVEDAVYFVTAVAAPLVVAAAWQIVRRRGATAAKGGKLRAAAVPAATLAAALLVNLVPVPATARVDFTASHRFTLSKQSKTVLGNVKQKAVVTAFAPENTPQAATPPSCWPSSAGSTPTSTPGCSTSPKPRARRCASAPRTTARWPSRSATARRWWPPSWSRRSPAPCSAWPGPSPRRCAAWRATASAASTAKTRRASSWPAWPPSATGSRPGGSTSPWPRPSRRRARSWSWPARRRPCCRRRPISSTTSWPATGRCSCWPSRGVRTSTPSPPAGACGSSPAWSSTRPAPRSATPPRWWSRTSPASRRCRRASTPPGS